MSRRTALVDATGFGRGRRDGVKFDSPHFTAFA